MIIYNHIAKLLLIMTIIVAPSNSWSSSVKRQYSSIIVISNEKLEIITSKKVEVKEKKEPEEKDTEKPENNKNDRKSEDSTDKEKAAEDKNQQNTEEKDLEKKAKKYEIQKTPHKFTVNIKSKTLFEDDTMRMFGSLSKNKAMMLEIEKSDVISLSNFQIMKEVDILLVRKNGTIDTIIEDSIPSELDDILTSKPVKAIIFIKSGLTKELEIIPSSKVNHRLFKPDPKILQ